MALSPEKMVLEVNDGSLHHWFCNLKSDAYGFYYNIP